MLFVSFSVALITPRLLFRLLPSRCLFLLSHNFFTSATVWVWKGGGEWDKRWRFNIIRVVLALIQFACVEISFPFEEAKNHRQEWLESWIATRNLKLFLQISSLYGVEVLADCSSTHKVEHQNHTKEDAAGGNESRFLLCMLRFANVASDSMKFSNATFQDFPENIRRSWNDRKAEVVPRKKGGGGQETTKIPPHDVSRWLLVSRFSLFWVFEEEENQSTARRRRQSWRSF